MTKKVVTNDGKKGGWLVGKRHYDKDGNSLGGIKAVVTDAGGKPVELEGGEVIINREASKKHWKELSRINQSAGNGVAIEPPSEAFDEDPSEDYEKGGKIEFNANHIPNKWILNFAIKVKAEHKDVWDLGGNIFGNQAFINLKRVAERGYWLDSEEWMYKKWRSYVARHQGDFRIEGVIAMLKWVDKVDRGWQYMKNLIEEEIKKRESRKSKKMSNGGSVKKGQELTLKDLEGQSFDFNVGNSGKKLNNASKSEIIDMIREAIKHYLFDASFVSSEYFNDYDDNKKEYKELYAKKIEAPLIKNIDKTLKEWFIFRDAERWEWADGKILEFDSKKTRKFIDNWFMKTNMSDELKQSYINWRLDYAGVDLKSKKMNDGGNLSKTPAPVSERIKGSRTNPKGTAKDAKSGSSIKFDENTLASIKSLIDAHNEKYPSKKITLGVAKAVVRRGMGAYSSTHRPTITGGKPNSRTAWGLARLKAFIQKAEKGKSKSGKYSQDNDLFDDLDIKISKFANGGLIAPNGKPSNLTSEQYKLVRTPEFKAWFGDWENDPKNASKVVDENGEPLVVYRGDSSASKKGFVFKTGFNRMSYISKDRLPNQYFHYFVDNYDVALGYGQNQIEDHNEKVAETGKGKLWEAKVTPYFLNIKNPIDITPNNSLFPTFTEYEKLQEKINGKAHVYRNSYDYGFYITQAELNKILENKLGADYLENTKETEELYSRVDEWAKESFRKSYYPEKTFAYFIEYKGSNSRSDILRRIYLKMLKNNIDGMVFLESTNWETDFFENWRKYESGELKYDSKRWVEKPKVFAALESNQIKLADGSNTTFDANNQDIRYDDGGNINFGKVSSASSRFRPSETIVFDPPLLGPNGNKLISYTWKYEWTTDFSTRTGDAIEKRVSDWSQAELSADTGRNIVHSFTIVKPNGESLSVSSESVPIVMGFVSKEQKKDFSNLATASKTLAKQQMQLSILEAQQKEFEEIKQSIIDAGYPEIEIKPWYSDDQVKLVMGDGSAVADANNPFEKERIEVLKESYVRGELAKLGIDWYRSNNSYQISELKKRIERQKRKVENITETSKMEDGGNVEIFNFTSYEDAQIWMKQKAKDYSNQNQFYASEEYKLAYPIIMQLYEIEKSSYVQKSKVAMKESGVNYGDRVIYDYITPFLNSEKYSGVVVERNGLPYVKLDEGQQTLSGAKSTRWHKGWKKQTSNFEHGGNLDAKDSVTIDIPLMIRLLELSREDIKSDAELHFVVENLLKLKNKPVLTMDDYAFIADVEHNHLKKYDLGGKMPEGKRTVDLGFGGLGNGTTVWDRNRIHNNDYKIVAHISNEGKITYYDKKLPEYAINQIESMAENDKKRYEDMNGLSTGYDFNPIQTPLN